MARIDTLENFLVDVATAIKEKRGFEPEQKILASNYDTEIMQISGGGDLKDATATVDDVLYPKTFYNKHGKQTGNIQPHYAADSVTLYQNYDLGHVGNTYQSGVSIHLEDYIFSYYKLSNVYYIQAINANTHQIEVTQSYTATDLFNNNENNNVLLTYDNYNNTEYTLVLAKGRNNGDGDTRIWARRVKFTVSTKQFTLIDGIAVGAWGDTGNNYGFAAVGTQMLPNNFGVLYSQWTDNMGFAFAGITWADTTGSIHNRANKSRIIPYSYGLEETGNGHIFSTPRAFIVINPTLTNYTYVNTSGYSYVSHDLRYMIYNRYLYRVTYNDNASTMFNSKVQIGTTQLPNYSWVRFSEDDSYIVLNSNGLNYIYIFDENGFISAQVINNVNQTLTGTDSDFQLINDTSTNLHLYKYDKGEVLTSVDIKGISYQHIEGQNVPANSNLVVNGTRYMGLNGVEVGSMPNNGELNYTPSVEQDRTIPSGYTSGGTVKKVTSAIDNNIQADNIKKGVEILGVTGTYEPTGGDATSDANIQAKYLLEGYEVVSDGKWVQGTMKNYGTTTIQRTSEVQEIPTGYYDLLTIPIAQAQNLDGYDECLAALEYVNTGGVSV